jgi:8-oxo-dGTP pyrophosphatase MutT (NUDIX family)
MNINYYIGEDHTPYHLSVGAVLLNDKEEVACHYFTDFQGVKDFYVLMRETVEPNESLEHALARGLKEEFGATGKLKNYIGSRITSFKRDQVGIQKTTLYFLITLDTFDPSLRNPDDEEKDSQIQWKPIDVLMAVMREQAKRTSHPELDESEILERVVKLKEQS